MKRYTNSFIGLMEQNKNGEWIKHSEAVKLLKFHSKQTLTARQETSKVEMDLMVTKNYFEFRILVLFLVLVSVLFLNLSTFAKLTSANKKLDQAVTTITACTTPTLK